MCQAIIWTNDDPVYWRIYTSIDLNGVNHKQMEMHVCVLITVATDVLVLKHQAISIHNAD